MSDQTRDAACDPVARENVHLHARIDRKNGQLNAANREIRDLRDFVTLTRAQYGSRMPDEWLDHAAAILGETL